MKSVFIAGSRKFFEEIEDLIHVLKQNKINVKTAGKGTMAGDTLETEKMALLTAFKNIMESNVCYVYSKDGYIGKTVAMEIAYAYARKKEIISSHKIDELSAQALVSKIIKPEKLAKYCI